MLVLRYKLTSIKGCNERILGIIAAVLLFSIMTYFSFSTSLTNQYSNPSVIFNFSEIGSQLINDYWIILQLTGLALAVSIVGALTMAKFENR